jgi:hypothetical protein
MRRDMNEVIIETGRSGGINKGRNKNWKRGFTADDPYFDGGPNRIFSTKASYNRKSQGDKLNPLRRFLRSRVGHKWDGVFSEICAVNDVRSMVGFHLLTHLKGYVKATGLDEDRFYGDFFVDSQGVLRQVSRKSYRARWREEARRAPIEQLPGDDGWIYKLIDGFWYRTKTETYQVPTSYEYLDEANGDVVIKRSPTKMVTETRDFKFQCGRKELKKIRERLNARYAEMRTQR